MLLTLLRKEDFLGQDAVAERFMRSSVVGENNDPLRIAKHYLAADFPPWFEALLLTIRHHFE